MSTQLVKKLVEAYFLETGESPDLQKDFLSVQDITFLNKNGFILEEYIDPHVKRYHGHYLPDDIYVLLLNRIRKDVYLPTTLASANASMSASFYDPDTTEIRPLVWININDNSDLGCETTYQVEIGIEEKYGFFAKSSSFCATIEAAFREAAIQFLYQLQPLKGPSIVCYRRRG